MRKNVKKPNDVWIKAWLADHCTCGVMGRMNGKNHCPNYGHQSCAYKHTPSRRKSKRQGGAK